MLRLSRSLHKWIAVVTAVPLLVIFVTGILLSISALVPALQPQPTPSSPQITIGLDEILDAARTVPEASIREWNDVAQLDLRPAKGIIRVRAKNYWEIQVDGVTGEVLAAAPRPKTLLITLHDGTWFGGTAMKYGVFLPSGLSAFFLLVTGLVLFIVPQMKKRRAKG